MVVICSILVAPTVDGWVESNQKLLRQWYRALPVWVVGSPLTIVLPQDLYTAFDYRRLSAAKLLSAAADDPSGGALVTVRIVYGEWAIPPGERTFIMMYSDTAAGVAAT